MYLTRPNPFRSMQIFLNEKTEQVPTVAVVRVRDLKFASFLAYATERFGKAQSIQLNVTLGSATIMTRIGYRCRFLAIGDDDDDQLNQK